MPVMDGEAFLIQRQALEHVRDIPVCIVSTESNQQRLDRIKELGANDRLAKPFEPEDLCRLIKKHLGVTT